MSHYHGAPLFYWQKGPGTKLVGSYISPFVRKISILPLEKDITSEFADELPYNVDSGMIRYNPLGKVPALITDEDEYWFNSPVIAEYIELLDIVPAMLSRGPLAALKVRQLEALADGIMNVDLVSAHEQACPAAQQLETELLRQCEKIIHSLDMLEGYLTDGTLKMDTVNLATIVTACAVSYFNFRQVAPGQCVNRLRLVKLMETLFQRESFARTKPPKV